ncbi:MAG: universal stress protein [Methanothrix sp.]|nr:universal stress protein [Methanothrix sp.]MDD4446343.1 universal stress protein [Methanothrix sp.]
MYEKILIATDFSKQAEKLIECVGEIPGVKEVVLLHVLAKDPLARVWSPGDEIKQAKSQMEAPKKVLEDANLLVKVRAEIAEETPEYVVIRHVAKEENVSLVVMGARGRSMWQGLLLGSVSSGVLRYGDKDLLIMRYKTLNEEKEELGKFCSRIFERVLAPTDFSPAGNAAIQKIKEAKLTNNVLLLNVVAKGEKQSQLDTSLENAHKKLEEMKADLAAAGISARTFAVSAAAEEPRTYSSGGMVKVGPSHMAAVGGVVDKILTVAEIEEASLIALGSHGKGWLDEVTIGSVASDVARMGQRPVLVVRSKK